MFVNRVLALLRLFLTLLDLPSNEWRDVSVALLHLPFSSAHFCINGSSRKAKILTLKREPCKFPPPPRCAQLLILTHKTSKPQAASGHAFTQFQGQPSSLLTVKVSPLLLTVDGEQHTGIAHPHHVLSNAGQQEPVVLTGDIHQGQIDGMNIGPVEVGLKIPERNTDRSKCPLASLIPAPAPSS